MIKFWRIETATVKIDLYSYATGDGNYALAQTIGVGRMVESPSIFTHGPIMHGNRTYPTTADVEAAAQDMIGAYRSMLDAEGAYNIDETEWK